MSLTAFAKSFIAHIWQNFTDQECPENFIIVLVNRKEALNRYRKFAGQIKTTEHLSADLVKTLEQRSYFTW